eukprot:COSAG06_NODE_7449_length_2501_cov_1.617818_2_plen_73_part_00
MEIDDHLPRQARDKRTQNQVEKEITFLLSAGSLDNPQLAAVFDMDGGGLTALEALRDGLCMRTVSKNGIFEL